MVVIVRLMEATEFTVEFSPRVNFKPYDDHRCSRLHDQLMPTSRPLTYLLTYLLSVCSPWAEISLED